MEEIAWADCDEVTAMIWYWMMVTLRKVVWLFKMPEPEAIGRADRNDKCPVCGATDGRMRCVWKAKLGPRAEGSPPNMAVFRQHTCNECGARRFKLPISKDATTETVLPSVARTELEGKEDRYQFQQTTIQ